MRINLKKLAGLSLLLLFAAVCAFGTPAKVQAKAKTASYIYTSGCYSKVKVNKKLTQMQLYARPYKADYSKQLKKGWYTFKFDSKTKFKMLTDTGTGATKKISKKSAVSKFKKKNFISAYVTIYTSKKNLVKEIVFGAF